MIRLQKGPEPEVLSREGARWTQEYVQALASGSLTATIRFRYRHREIKAALVAETHDKCAYCESKSTFADPGEIEHIRPVSKWRNLIADWPNLTFVCHNCNARKGDYDSDAEPLIHPYNDEPQEHIVFAGPLALNLKGDAKGLRTLIKLDLNRVRLIERRSERLEQVHQLVERWHLHPTIEPQTRGLLRKAVLALAEGDAEFAAAVRCFLSNLHPEILSASEPEAELSAH